MDPSSKASWSRFPLSKHWSSNGPMTSGAIKTKRGSAENARKLCRLIEDVSGACLSVPPNGAKQSCCVHF